MGATVQASYYGNSASEPAGVSAETGIKWTKDNSMAAGTTPVVIPTSAATRYAWIKQLALQVTVVSGSATNITNRRIQLASAPPVGLSFWALGSATYVNPSGGAEQPADGVANNNDLSATWTRLSGAANSTSGDGTAAAAFVWDNASVSSNATGRNGNFVRTILGVNANTGTNAYVTGAGPVLPNLLLIYDEA